MPHHVTFVAIRVAGQGKRLQKGVKTLANMMMSVGDIKMKVKVIKAGCVGGQRRQSENVENIQN